jgi:hypothetical protein
MFKLNILFDIYIYIYIYCLFNYVNDADDDDAPMDVVGRTWKR